MDFLHTVYEFLNSPVGLLIVAALISWLTKKVYFRKPGWKEIVDKYKPSLMSAVKYAEKKIDDKHPNKTLARLDMALEYIIDLNRELAKNEEDVKHALTVTHAEAEKDGNL